MPNVPWRILKNSHPRAHLVAGAMQADQPATDSDLNKAYVGLERLVRELETTGTYAMMIVRNARGSGVHLAFEVEGEARRFAAAVNAELTEGYPGWTTQQSFPLIGETERVLAPLTAQPETKRPLRTKLNHDINLLGKTIQSNALTIKSKTMSNEDREALQRHMTTRMAHQKLMQQRLDRLSK
jgi:hypothetical protein